MFTKEISSQLEISANPEQIWQVLTDFEKYAQWNPFIIKAAGVAAEGNQIEGYFQPVGAKPTRIKPRVIKASKPQELRWRGKVGMRGLFDAEHIFTIEVVGTNLVRFSQREKFSGLFVPFFKFDGSLAAFNLMNQALKERVEKS